MRLESAQRNPKPSAFEMAKASTYLPGAYVKREKLKGHENWARWADLTRTLLEKECVWDLVGNSPRRRTTRWDQTAKEQKEEAKESRVAIATAAAIIKE